MKLNELSPAVRAASIKLETNNPGIEKLYARLAGTISSNQNVQEDIDPGFLANFASAAPGITRFILTKSIEKAKQEKDETVHMMKTMWAIAKGNPVSPEDDKQMRDQFKDLLSYGLIAVGSLISLGPAAGSGMAITGFYKKELLDAIRKKGPDVIIDLMKQSGVDIVKKLMTEFLSKNVVPHVTTTKNVQEANHNTNKKISHILEGISKVTNSKISLLEANGKMVRGMLVQTPEQFLKATGVEPATDELDEELEPGEQPIRFNPKFRPQYSASKDVDEPAGKSGKEEYAKPISPEQIAQLVHHKNSYVIYYDAKSHDKGTYEKSITTKPIYLSKDKIEELSSIATDEVNKKYPNISDRDKKPKVYAILDKLLRQAAVQEATKASPEIALALANGIITPTTKLKAKPFTTRAERIKYPYIHKSSVPILDDNGEIIYDLDGFAARITARPEKLLKVNEKMAKSASKDISIANIGIPAITGLVVDEKSKQFLVVSTCPGAGTCKAGCYATAKGYIQYKAGSESPTRTLNYWFNDPEGFKNQIIQELKSLVKPGVKVYLRWHDAGDFFNKDYLHLAFDVARAVPEATIYAYTKIASVVKDSSMPKNFIINFSEGALPNETKQINFKDTKHSVIVPAELFKSYKDTGIGLTRLQNRDPEAQKKLKEKLAEKYGIDIRTILTYDEMLEKPEGNKLKWNVIVVPGLDGDLGAARRDVLGSYLLYH